MRFSNLRRSLVLAAAGLSLAAHALAAYPDRAIRLVVPYAPAGGTDNVARLLADKLSERFRQPVIVDNRPGANGNIGGDAVARAPADGYTLLFAGMGPLAVNPSLFANMPYSPVKAFEPIAVVSSAPLVLVAGPKTAKFDLPGLVQAFGSQPPRTLTLANAGEGSPQHICAGLFAGAAGLSVTHVPYKGAAPAITDLLGGNVDAACDNVGTIRPFIQAAKVRPLAVSTKKRSGLLPDVPTFEEQGLKGIDFSLWFMLVAPAGTPDGVVQTLNTAVNDILANPDVKARLRELANEPIGGTMAAAKEHLVQENKRWPSLIKALGISTQ